MKRIITLLILIAPLLGYSQSIINQGTPNTLVKNRGSFSTDSIQGIPIRDTIDWNGLYGNLTIRPQDGKLYYRSNGSWKSVDNGGGGNDTISNVFSGTLSQARALNTIPDVIVLTDYGGGTFVKNDTVTVDNTGTQIITAGGQGYSRIYEGALDVTWFGAKGDGVTNNDSFLDKAIETTRGNAEKNIRFGNGVYRFSKTIMVTQQDRGIAFEGVGADKRTTGDIQSGSCLFFQPTTDSVLFMIGERDSLPEGVPLYSGVQGVSFKNLNIRTEGGNSGDIVTWPAAKYRTGTIGIEDNRGGQIHIENVWIQGFDTGAKFINSDFSRSINFKAYYCNIGMYLGPRSDQNLHTGSDFTFCNTAFVVAGASGVSFVEPNIVMCGTTSTASVVIKQGDQSNPVNGLSIISPWFEVDAATLVANAGNIDLHGFLDIGSELTGSGFVDGLSIISPAGTHSYNAPFGNVNRFATIQKARSISILGCRSMAFKNTGLYLSGEFSPTVSVEGYNIQSTKTSENTGVVTTNTNIGTFNSISGKQKFLNVNGNTNVSFSTIDARHGTVFESGTNDVGVWIAAPNSASLYMGNPTSANNAGLLKYLRFNHDANNSVRLESNGKQAVFELQGLYLGNATRDNTAPGAIGSVVAVPEINVAPGTPINGFAMYSKSGKPTFKGTDGVEFSIPTTLPNNLIHNGGDDYGSSFRIGSTSNNAVSIIANNTPQLTVGNGYVSTSTIIQPASGNNARLDLQTTGFRFSRGVVDGNPVAKFNKPSGSTGRILEAQINDSTVAYIDFAGRLYRGANAYTSGGKDFIVKNRTNGRDEIFSGDSIYTKSEIDARYLPKTFSSAQTVNTKGYSLDIANVDGSGDGYIYLSANEGRGTSILLQDTSAYISAENVYFDGMLGDSTYAGIDSDGKLIRMTKPTISSVDTTIKINYTTTNSTTTTVASIPIPSGSVWDVQARVVAASSASEAAKFLKTAIVGSSAGAVSLLDGGLVDIIADMQSSGMTMTNFDLVPSGGTLQVRVTGISAAVNWKIYLTINTLP